MSLEDELLYLEKFGKPFLHKTSDGWRCSLEVFVTGEGINVDIKSEMNHRLPYEAATLCRNRLQVLLSSLSKAVSTISSGVQL